MRCRYGNQRKAEHDHALRLLRVDYGQRVFPERSAGPYLLLRRIFSASARMMAASPLPQVWSRSSDISRTCTLTPRILHISRAGTCFSPEFLEYLSRFRFTGDIWAVPEGTPIFPHEPIITVRAPAIEAQLVETFLLLAVNHQSLIATKANRITRAARGRTVLEFGSRRAQGTDAAITGARAAYIGGWPEPPAPSPTSCTVRTRRRHHGPCLGPDVRQRAGGVQDLL